MAGEGQSQPDIPAQGDRMASNDVPSTGNGLDLVSLSMAQRRDRVTEVDRGMDMLRNGDLERFGNYLTRNPDVAERMTRELSRYGIQMDIQKSEVDGKPKTEITLSTPIENEPSIRRALVISGKNVSPQILIKTGQIESGNEAIERFKAGGNTVSIDAFKTELLKRVPPRPGQTQLG